MTYDQVIGAAASGANIKVVMPIDYSNGGDAVLADMSIQTDHRPERPRRLLMLRCHLLIFLDLLCAPGQRMTDKGHQPGEHDAGSDSVGHGIRRRSCGTTMSPNVYRRYWLWMAQKFHVIYSSREAPGLIADVLVFDDEHIKKNGKEITNLIKAYLDGLAYMKSNPEDRCRHHRQRPIGVSGKEVLEQLQGVYNIPAKEMQKPFAKGKDTKSYFVSGEVINEILMKSGQIKKVVAISSTLDDRFVKALSK